MLNKALPRNRAPEAITRFAGQSFVAMMPVIAVAYVLLVLPFQNIVEGGRIINNIFWPVASALVLSIAYINKSKLDREYLTSLPVLSLAAYFLLAGASVFWALSPDLAFSRYVAHLLTAIVIVVPYALPIRTPNTVFSLQLASAIGLVVNGLFVVLTNPGPLGHAGYFNHKQELGTFGAIAVILAFHGLFRPGWGRPLSVFSLAIAVWILLASESKSSFAFAFMSIAFAGGVLLVCWAASYAMRITPAYILIVLAIAASFVSNPMERLGYSFYGDPSLTGRTEIWDYVNSKIAEHPWLGWGFHSYYFVPNSPQFDAPGFISDMPSSHSGYLELLLETGRIGYWIFVVFIFSSLHGIEQIRRKDPATAWLFLTIFIYAILVNFLDSYWLVLSQLWLLYLVVMAETVRGALKNAAPSRAAVRPNFAGRKSLRLATVSAVQGAKRPAAKFNF